jgi:hypothetical protein
VTSSAAEAPPLSAECTLAQRDGYEGLHLDCRQTKDIPLPGAVGVVLQRRCGCTCHSFFAWSWRSGTPDGSGVPPSDHSTGTGVSATASG